MTVCVTVTVRLSSALSTLSSTAVTVTVRGLFQLLSVNVRLAGETVAAATSPLSTATVTVPAAGCESSTTV